MLSRTIHTLIATALVLLLGSGMELFGQPFPIFNGTDVTCVGAFLDSGGEGGVGYSNNENFTYTICPDNPNDAISLNFITFNLDGTGPGPVDFMTIYDGNSTAAPSLGTYTGNALDGYVVNASPLNNTGCLTVVFRSNAAGIGVFAASITCYTPCQRPTAVAVMSEAAPAMICPGEAVTFNSSGSFAAPGFTIATRNWDWGDGTFTNGAPVSTSHVYAQPGYYQAQLYLIDDNGCASTNRVDLEVLVGTEPDFLGTGGDIIGCTGEELCLDAIVNATTFNELPSGDLGNGVFLADEVGSCFTAEITYTQFAPGQTLNSIADLFSICMNMEHSFIGDLVVRIISPTGQIVTMHQQGGGATFLGIPVDNDATPNAQGTCMQYCFSPTATNGTWVDNAAATLPPGDYESLNNLNGLLGSQLNGIWQLQICDLWASDNGFVCDWNINFDPNLFPDLLEFTPVYGTDCDSSSWTGPNITSTTGNCQGVCTTPPAPGNFNYTYSVTDNFGCTYDTVLTITVIPPAVIDAGADVTTCGDPVQLDASIVSGGFPSDCVYQLVLNDSYGDGWTIGSSISVSVDGVSTNYTLADGSTTTINIPVTNGSSVILNYTAAILWNGEQSFTLINSTGGVAYNSPAGPASGSPWSGAAVCPVGAFVYSWTPTGGLSNPNIANPIATVSSTTTYCVSVYQVGHPGCVATDCVDVLFDTAPDPGTNGNITVCETSSPINLFSQLVGTPEAGGAWTTPSSTPHSGNFIPGTDVPGSYTYTTTGSGACGPATASATVQVIVNLLADAGDNGDVTVCSNAGPTGLFAELEGTPTAGGTWSGPSPITGDAFDPNSMNGGLYTYSVPSPAPCPAATAEVFVVIQQPVDAGTDGAIVLCSTDGPASLFAQLGGAPAAGGIWSGPSAVVGGMIDPAVMTAGDYTYTVAGAAPCPNETATVTVTINTPPDAGTNGSITLCSTDAAASLIAQLGGSPDAGGSWTGPSAVVGGMIDPATMLAGVYTYTVVGTAPCPDDMATVTVTINTPPDPGTDGTITLCSTDAAASLFAQLGGSPTAGGSWSGPSAVVGGIIDPATMSAGDYTYTVTGTAPCPDETAMVTVTINTPPDAGTNGSITLCSTDAAASLIAQLGGSPDAGGSWTGPSAVVGGMIDPATMLAGVYTYTVVGTAPCPDDMATVTVTINTPPDPGTDGTITLCSTDAAASLFAQLGGSPTAGGTWTGPSAVIGEMIDPATMTAGDYTYTVAGTAPCPDETATVTVTINTPPDAGTNGSITLCSTDAAASLIAQLGGSPDAGGSWTGPSAVVGGMIDPATMLAGVYTYTVVGTAPCPDDMATVTVTINTPPDPGTDGTITLCSTDAAASLFAQLGGSPTAGGTWSGPSAVVGGIIDPATMSAGDYTYTVAGTAPCPDETATVTVTINTPPDAGTNGSITLCSTDAAASLIAQLGGSPDAGGSWTGPSAVVGGMIDPATMLAGVYTYTVVGTAPCPDDMATVTVTINTPPDPGTDSAITLCATDAAASLFAQLGGSPTAGGSWSGPSAVVGGIIDPATMSAGDYTYTVTGTAPCPNETATVTVTINTPPDPGTNGSITLCSTDAAASLIAQLGGSPDAGGTWSGPSAVVGGMIDPATMNAGDYTYTVIGTAPCPDDIATVTVTINTPPDPGTDGTITLCSTDAAASLFAQLGGSPTAGGTWSGPSAVIGEMIDPATMTAGDYTYTVVGTPPCPDETATVTVSINIPPNAGIDGDITLCVTSPATSLFEALTGAPDAGGSWTGPSAVAGGMFDPATMTAGDYTYTVIGTTPCPSDASIVSVSVVSTPDAGLPGLITLCSSDAAIALFDQLTGTPDAGGAWTGPSAVVGGMYDPATMTAGVYTYTITVPPPCVRVSSTVTVTEIAPPNAGIDGSITLCVSSPATSLFAALTGAPDAGGTWTGPSAVVGGMFDPAVMTTGDYTYTVAGTAPCPSDASVVSVTVVNTPDAGLPGNATLCTSDEAIALFDQLTDTPDAGGAWTGPSAVVGGMYDPATMTAGVYTYTITVPPPCVSVSSTVTVTEIAPPNAGIDGDITLCISSPATSLFAALTGAPDAGGSWTGPSAVLGGMFDPATMTAGDYTYTVTGTTPCPSDASVVSVSVVNTPDAGLPGLITLCSSDVGIALFDQLTGTPDAGGAWTGPSAVVGGMYDPATMTAGVYTYTITVPPPCVSVSSTVTVTEIAPPNAGIDGSITLCVSSPATSLFAALTGAPDAGGTWTGPSAVVGGMFDPATMTAGDYTYTVTGTAPCPSDASIVNVSVVSTPDAGLPGLITLCSSDAAIALFDQLTGTPDAGGTWTGPSAVVGGLYDPATMTAGVYTYTITVPPPCVSVSSTVTVTEIAPPNAGIDGSITLCVSSPATSLFAALTGAPDAGGTWTGPSAVVGGMFDPPTMTGGDYTYTVAGTTPCPSDASVVSVSVVNTPDAGLPGLITLCSSDVGIALFDQLTGTPDAGGAWTGPSAVVGGMYDPATMTAGVYTYTITVPPPCVSVSSTVTVTEIAPPNAGIDGDITLCISSPATSLFAALTGAPDAGGSWTGPSAVAGGMFDPATMTAGDYTYTVAGTAPCPSDASVVSVTVVNTPDAGLPGIATLCTSDEAIALFDQLTGTPDAGGAWTGPSAVVGGMYDPATMTAGVYAYTIDVPPPCVSVSSTVTMTEVNPPDAGTDGSMTVCISSPAGSLFGQLTGTPDAGGTWTGPSAVVGGMFDPATMTAGDYTYTVSGTTPCPSDASVVSVTVVNTPDAGLPGNATLCTSDAAIVLFDQLTGTPDAGGAWTGPSAVVGGMYDPATMTAGVYTYTIDVPPPCVSVSSTVTVTEVVPPNAGIDGSMTVCISSPAGSLFDQLTGTPEAGGTWTGPSAVVGGMFDPATMTAGDYTYTVAGYAPCPSDASVVSVTVVNTPNAGLPGNATLCTSDEAIALFDQLTGTPDAGGAWTGPSAVVGGMFDPSSMLEGIYSYTIDVPPPCSSVSSTITISISQPPIAGVDASIVLCNVSDVEDLFPHLGNTAEPGGVWSGPSAGALDGTFDPATDQQGIYVYTVSGTSPCPAAIAAVEVTVVSTPDPGEDGMITVCGTDQPFELFDQLLGAPDVGGTWTNSAGIAFVETFDPDQHSSGIYTYTINAPAPCQSASSNVTVTVVQPPNAGLDGSVTLCTNGSALDLFTQLSGNADPGGTWSGPGAFGPDGSFDPSIGVAGVYVYQVEGTAPCPADASEVVVALTQTPNAGQNATLNLCISGSPLDIFPSLGGAELGGTWTGPNNTPFTGVFTPGTNVNGNYTYTVPGIAPCPSASAVITIQQLTDPDAGQNGEIILCTTDLPATLFNNLQGTPNTGGSWFMPDGTPFNGIFDGTIHPAGTYSYIIQVPPPCISDTAFVFVTTVQGPDAGTDGSATLCDNEPAIPLFAELGGTPDTNGSWTGPGSFNATHFTPGADVPGNYIYTVPGATPCPNATALVVIDVNPLPYAGGNGYLSLCPGAAPVSLFDRLEGTPDPGGIWTGPGGIPSNGVFDPSTDPQGIYTYTVYGIQPCPNASSTATVNVFVVPAPDAGPDTIICDLTFALNATGEWATGVWTNANGATFGNITDPASIVSVPSGGNYTFIWSTITADGCASSDTVNVLFTDPIIANVTVTDAICFGACDGTATVAATGGNAVPGAYTFSWSVTGTVDTTAISGLCASSFTVTVADTNACPATISFIIDQPEPLTIATVVGQSETCPGDCDGIMIIEDTVGVLFSLNDGPYSTQTIYGGLCPGDYVVHMQNIDGCEASGSGSVGTPPVVEASFFFDPDTLFVNDPTTIMVNTSLNATNFAWEVDGIGVSTELSPTYTFTSDLGSTYMVCLTATDDNGCPDTYCEPISVFDLLDVFVPNAFTPNDDDINDGFRPIFNRDHGIENYRFMVFNRWGEELFSTEVIDATWNGNYSGLRSKTEVYVWKVRYRDAYTGELYDRIGHVTLLK